MWSLADGFRLISSFGDAKYSVREQERDVQTRSLNLEIEDLGSGVYFLKCFGENLAQNKTPSERFFPSKSLLLPGPSSFQK